MTQLFTNNASSVLANAASNVATSMVLLAGQGVRFPAPTGGNFFLLTLIGRDVGGIENAWEIVKVTARSVDTLTVVRAQEGTAAVAWGVGTPAQARATAGTLGALEPTVVPGDVSQYWGGDKNWRDLFTDVRGTPLTGLSTAVGGVITAPDTTLSALGKLQKQASDHLIDVANPHTTTKTQVGLGNVDNTSDGAKPVSSAQQTALNLKANLASPALTGVPTAPTAAAGNNTAAIATTAFATTAIANAISHLSSTANLVWDAATDTYTQNTLGASSVTDIHRGMRRCIVKSDGTVNYYLHATNSTLKEDGTAAIITGADGNVMVEVPAFYVQYLYSGTTHNWAVSLYPRAGFYIHPAFIKAGVQASHRYIGAYDACVNTTGATYQSGLNWDNNVGAGQLWNTTTAKLASVSGIHPAIGVTRAEFRSMAANVGAGWHQLDYNLYSAIYLLYLIEFGSFRSQDITGIGNTQSSYPLGSGVQTDSPHSIAGKSNASGNATGWLNSAAKDTAWMSYRGIENLYGNCWSFADGFNALLGVPYVCGDYTKFADDTATGHTAVGGQMPASGGSYIKDIQAYASGFIPSVVGGSSTSFVPDGLWTSIGANTILLLGGVADGAALGGVGAANANDASAYRDRTVGARLSR